MVLECLFHWSRGRSFSLPQILFKNNARLLTETTFIGAAQRFF